jgi:hypothetical protein
MMTKLIFYFPANSGPVCAAYGGVFSVLSILWGWRIDRINPDRYDILFKPKQEEKIKAHGVRSHCGGEADIFRSVCLSDGPLSHETQSSVQKSI